MSDDRLLEHRQAIPPEWDAAHPAVEEALDRIRNARDNLDGVIAEDKGGAAMTEKQAYSYTVLRYIHDVVSGEALNVGVVMHAPAAGS